MLEQQMCRQAQTKDSTSNSRNSLHAYQLWVDLLQRMWSNQNMMMPGKTILKYESKKKKIFGFIC